MLIHTDHQTIIVCKLASHAEIHVEGPFPDGLSPRSIDTLDFLGLWHHVPSNLGKTIS